MYIFFRLVNLKITFVLRILEPRYFFVVVFRFVIQHCFNLITALLGNFNFHELTSLVVPSAFENDVRDEFQSQVQRTCFSAKQSRFDLPLQRVYGIGSWLVKKTSHENLFFILFWTLPFNMVVIASSDFKIQCLLAIQESF